MSEGHVKGLSGWDRVSEDRSDRKEIGFYPGGTYRERKEG